MYYYSADAFPENDTMNSTSALALAIWHGILGGHFNNPYFMFFSNSTGYVNFEYHVNLTNANDTDYDIDFTIWAWNTTDDGMTTTNASVYFNSSYPIN